MRTIMLIVGLFALALGLAISILLFGNTAQAESEPIESIGVLESFTRQEVNARPTVNAGPDLFQVQLTGTVEDDGLPTDTLTIVWSQVAGPAPVFFINPSFAASGVLFPKIAGVYELRLTAHDGQSSSFDDVSITLSFPAPTQ